MFIDSHCHLDSSDFINDGVDKVIERAKQSNVNHMVTICTEIAKFPNILAIAKQSKQVDCTIGTHPHNADEEIEKSFSLEYIIEQTKLHQEIIGIGETGLDYYYDNAPKDVQIDSFRKHLKASVETGLPVIVHTRNADEDTIKLLQEEYSDGRLTGVLHCFSSGAELAEQALDLGFYISISGIITFKNAQDLRDIVKNVPLDKILIETDAPYLAPIPHRGKCNEPAFVAHTAAKLAEIKDVSVEEIGRVTTKNFYNLFKHASNKEINI